MPVSSPLRCSTRLLLSGILFSGLLLPGAAPGQTPPKLCRKAVVLAELTAGENLSRPLSPDLRIWFQSIQSGWILRVVPASSTSPVHDYAEVATPPYNSVSPLSLSTDFSFRSQDAVGWNPRRFRYAASPTQYRELLSLYTQVVKRSAAPPDVTASGLTSQLATTPEGKLTILDSRLVPGMNNQGIAAAAVSSAFEKTAHSFAVSQDGKAMPLGKLLWISFKLELDLPPGFMPAPGITTSPYPCGSL